ncbi:MULTISPECIES: RNA polymerase sigma factor [Nocardioides]|uniref:RNA polymerase sigma factor n=1 Tax=Nocardioides vastitatis TaxID=2568655 RepID=A0ABW0ZMP6_9ACTN|nr:sigma-70 family RNA polymerase sigma factor [Nocardioides sp.]THJ04157.1 sigma-70 family RNA polymerase sigma factor [Nocardioides sp.]
MLHPAPLDDADLLTRARSGDDSAVAALYEIYRGPALRLAQVLAGPDEAADLLSDVFVRIVARFRAGAGPSSNFRGYLFTAIRNRHRDLRRRSGHEDPVSHQPWLLEDITPPVDEIPEDFCEDHAAAALATLPDAWRRVLWLIEVEELHVREVADRLGLNPAAVASLAYRAREGLRTAYLEQLVRCVAATSSECGWVRERLGRYVRAGLSTRAACRIASHLEACVVCARSCTDLQRVNSRFHFCRRMASQSAQAPAS